MRTRGAVDACFAPARTGDSRGRGKRAAAPPSAVSDAHMRMSLELQAAFGLRREEAMFVMGPAA